MRPCVVVALFVFLVKLTQGYTVLCETPTADRQAFCDAAQCSIALPLLNFKVARAQSTNPTVFQCEWKSQERTVVMHIVVEHATMENMHPGTAAGIGACELILDFEHFSTYSDAVRYLSSIDPKDLQNVTFIPCPTGKTAPIQRVQVLMWQRAQQAISSSSVTQTASSETPRFILEAPLAPVECMGTGADSKDEYNKQLTRIFEDAIVWDLQTSKQVDVANKPFNWTILVDQLVQSGGCNSSIPLELLLFNSVSGEPLFTGESQTTPAKLMTVLQMHDRAAPIFENIPTQPAHIPYQVSCLDQAVDLAAVTIPKHMNAYINALDTCQGEVPWQFQFNVVPYGCSDRGVMNLEWISQDKCGNGIRVVQSVRIFDTEHPVWSKTLPSHMCYTGSPREDGSVCINPSQLATAFHTSNPVAVDACGRVNLQATVSDAHACVMSRTGSTQCRTESLKLTTNKDDTVCVGSGITTSQRDILRFNLLVRAADPCGNLNPWTFHVPLYLVSDRQLCTRLSSSP